LIEAASFSDLLFIVCERHLQILLVTDSFTSEFIVIKKLKFFFPLTLFFAD